MMTCEQYLTCAAQMIRFETNVIQAGSSFLQKRELLLSMQADFI